ncbi:CRISPR-associated helicase Cas3' [bacterium]|nr:CRISPR-associated helicase Cas3' [bacterium]
MSYYARPGQYLFDHLEHVSQKAASFCSKFGSAEWGRVAGLWHDIGKYQGAFQQRLTNNSIHCEHSGAGAALAVERSKELGIPLAFVIAGHHTGLSNWITSETGTADSIKPLRERLELNRAILDSIRDVIQPEIVNAPLPDGLPTFFQLSKTSAVGNEALRSREFWVRFLFSALVDADWLDSEAAGEPTKAALRRKYALIPDLRTRLDEAINAKVAELTEEDRARPVNHARAIVLQACRDAANEPHGLFSLTVPTGGGKTLSAMSFALRHAERHGLDRVIVVIPFTSIIEQNAAVYRSTLGAENVVEHHSNLDPERQRERYGEESAMREELAAENWDAPVIVTTTVQFFESLFTNHPGRARKIHNIARSVVILDEVQTLPPELLLPILDALRELAAHYGSTVVLSTATPPALQKRDRLPQGLEQIRPIIAPENLTVKDTGLARRLSRVRYEWPNPDASAIEWEQLADVLARPENARSMAIVHRRADARKLAQMVKERVSERDPVFHLSALMCPAHRTQRLQEIGDALKGGGPCRLVSTQLVEAGVDLDFPVVWRALGGLDSMVQAAGRCNREGKLPGPGRVVVFRAPTPPPSGTPRKALDSVLAMLNANGGSLGEDDAGVAEKIEEYFRRLYVSGDLDGKNIQRERAIFNFAAVGRLFRMIDDFSETVVVGWGEKGKSALLRLQAEGPSRDALRAVQPFTVKVYHQVFDKWLKNNVITEVTGFEERSTGIYTLQSCYTQIYDQVFGLFDGDEPVANPSALFCDK